MKFIKGTVALGRVQVLLDHHLSNQTNTAQGLYTANVEGLQPLDIAVRTQQWGCVQRLVGAGALEYANCLKEVRRQSEEVLLVRSYEYKRLARISCNPITVREKRRRFYHFWAPFDKLIRRA